jgi:hypothetical protein
MTSDPNNPQTIRRDLQCWRDLLKTGDIEPDARKALYDLIDDAETLLADIEGHNEAH